jgi:hypothetical protein
MRVPPGASPAPSLARCACGLGLAGPAPGGTTHKEVNMELRCPHCASPEVEPKSEEEPEILRCGNCGEGCEREGALVSVFDAEGHLDETVQGECFAFEAERAAAELADPDGAISPISPHSDPDELNRLLEIAQDQDVIKKNRERVRIYVYPLSLGEPDPLLAVDPGCGPTLLGYELSLHQADGEDPIAFTVRVIGEVVAQANGLAGSRAADSDRLDRLAAFLNRPGQWNGGDVCEFLAKEIVASGRQLRDADE